MSNFQNNIANPLDQQVRSYDDRPAAASNQKLSDEEKWRLQEEQWANAEQARYGVSATNAFANNNNNSGLSYIRSMSDSEMAVPFNSPAGTASNNNSIRNHPNVMADDTAPMDAERFGKLRSYYDRSAPGNTMASDMAGIQHKQLDLQQQQQQPLGDQQFSSQPLPMEFQESEAQPTIPSELQQVYNNEQKHFEQNKQIHEHALLEELNDPARLHHQQLQQQQQQKLQQPSPLHEEQQPLLPHQVPDQQLQEQDQPLSHHKNLQKQQSPLREKQLKDHEGLPPLLQQEQQGNNFVDPNLDINAAGGAQNSYYHNNSNFNTNKSSITSADASTRSLVKEDGIEPYDGQAADLNIQNREGLASNFIPEQNNMQKVEEAKISPTLSPASITPAAVAAKIIRANHDFDQQNIAEHGAIMSAEGERYNAVAEAAGIPSRINDDVENSEYGSPTAFLDDAQILEEKAKQAELERRIAERNKEYEERLKQEEIKQERSKELGLAGVAAGAGPATQQRKQSEIYERIVNEPYDENATGDNFVAMGKPRGNNINAEGLSPSAIRARELKQQQSAGIPEAEAKKKENTPKMADAVRAQLNMPSRIKPEDGIPLGAQTYTGQPPKPINPIHEDIPDLWLERYRQDTQERRAQKEAQRRIELNRRAEEKGGFANKIAAVFDDTKASFKKSKQEHDLKAEDKKLASNNLRAKERMSKYFPMHTSERFVCAFDAQALHHHMPFAGHVILTDKTLCFVGKGYEDAELAASDAAMASAPSSYNNRLSNNSNLSQHEKKDAQMSGHAHKKEHVLVKEAIPLANIASIAMGSVVKNNGLVFILDATDAIVVADALQIFTTDGRIFQFRSFSHPCVTKKGKSYDGRTVPAMHRFLNYLDHKWREMGGGMQHQYQQQQVQQPLL